MVNRPLRATFDASRVVVWQAHGAEIADHALAHGRFGGAGWRRDRLTGFRLSLPSLLARSDWGRAEGRERILAVSLSRDGFDALVHQAVLAENDPSVYPSAASWRLATRYANVTVAWHPDVDLGGVELPWQTPRFGVRDRAMERFSESIVAIEDWTGHLSNPSTLASPAVAPYPVDEARLRLLAGSGGA